MYTLLSLPSKVYVEHAKNRPINHSFVYFSFSLFIYSCDRTLTQEREGKGLSTVEEAWSGTSQREEGREGGREEDDNRHGHGV